MKFNSKDFDFIRSAIGREPRGIVDIVCRNADGNPSVLLMSPWMDRQPFPTTFWLCDPKLDRMIAELESKGAIDQIKSTIMRSPELYEQHRFDQLYYAHFRYQLVTEARLDLQESYEKVLRFSGIGGMQDYREIKCLHLHYAYHLVTPTLVGTMIDRLL